VLLDVRLAEDRAREAQSETEASIDRLSGVELAQSFQRKAPAVPIIAATASNKSWTFSALLERGINAYWVKEVPGHEDLADHAAQNALDFCKKLNNTLQWSWYTRGWVETAYAIKHAVESSGNYVVAKRLEVKARSLNALLHSAPSPFSRELAEGLQWNLAFLILFSCMNDLISWVCRVVSDPATEQETWYLEVEGKEEPLVVKRQEGENDDDSVFEVIYLDPNRENHTSKWYFPDSKAATEMLFRMGLRSEAKKFIKLNRIRNGLPLIHGKPTGLGSTSESIALVSRDDIDNIVGILKATVDRHCSGTRT
jgi:CheY-like chemotaxis protein